MMKAVQQGGGTTLFLVRHGETEDNVRQIMQGQSQGRLTLHGVEQAETLARQLADEPIDAFLSSDLRRAVDTAAILAAPHHLPVETTPLLRERDWGDFTGRFIPDLKDEPWPDNVESMADMMQRAASFLEYVRTHYPRQRVVAVGHGIFNKALQAVYHQKPIHEIPRMGNAELRVLELP